MIIVLVVWKQRGGSTGPMLFSPTEEKEVRGSVVHLSEFNVNRKMTVIMENAEDDWRNNSEYAKDGSIRVSENFSVGESEFSEDFSVRDAEYDQDPNFTEEYLFGTDDERSLIDYSESSDDETVYGTESTSSSDSYF